MRYDSKVDAFYIEFAKGKYEKTRKISESVMVDEDKNGKVLGIEILDASENIPSFDPKKLTIQTA